MDISVEELNSVDREVEITATREELEPKFDEAIKKYRKQISMPGFRPGKVPKSIIRKRFGDEIEREEINNYIDEVYQNQIAEEYEPVGEPQVLDFSWEDDKLVAKLKIGVKPEFELNDPSEIEVDKMVHDVTDEDVEEEINRMLEQQGTWEETDEEITEKSKVTADVTAMDEDGGLLEEETDEDQEMDLRQDELSDFKEVLVDAKAGDDVEADVGEGEDQERYLISIKKVEKLSLPKLTDEMAKEQSDGEAEDVEQFRSYVKSKMQEAYDSKAEEYFQDELTTKLVEAHDFEVPESFLKQVKDMYVQQIQQQMGGQLPEGFDFDYYRDQMGGRALHDAQWFFINQKLQEKYDDIEIQPEDIDNYISNEAANYGQTLDERKQAYAQNPQALEQLRTRIRENKVLERLKEEVKVNELSRDEFQEKKKKEQEAKEQEAKQQQEASEKQADSAEESEEAEDQS
mgnify:CR=1 FL=1